MSTVLDLPPDFWLYCEQRLQRRDVQKNNNYLINYRRYIKWLQNNYNNNELQIQIETHPINQEFIFITTNNVEIYFEKAVVEYLGMLSTIKNHLNALKFYREHYEYPLGSPLIETPTIHHWISQQQLNASYSMKFIDSDPHKGIRDIMSKEDINKVITTIYTHRPDSLDLAFSFLWGINAGVRGSSSRAFKLSDLYISNGYGPEDHPPRNKTLLLILRKGSIHKDKHTTCRLVGVHRHREYPLCTVFATGLIVIHILRTHNNIHFYKPQNQRSTWWDIPVNKYTEYIHESQAMRDVLAVANVKSTKVTHHRWQAVQTAGTNGLRMEQVQTITKHVTNRLNSSYQPEVEMEVLKVMSGFKKVCFIIMFVSLIF